MFTFDCLRFASALTFIRQGFVNMYINAEDVCVYNPKS